MSVLRGVLYSVLSLYWMILVARLVLGYVQMFARDWRPRGIVLVVAEAVYTLTDPPLRLLRRILPPLRLGGVSIDLAFLALFLLLGAATNAL